MGVYQGTALASLTAIATNDDFASSTSNESGVRFTVETEGTEYFIAVDMFFQKTPGPVTLNWALAPVPSLDAPTMVYNLRTTFINQGTDFVPSGENPVYDRRSTSISNALVVRGRGEGAFSGEDGDVDFNVTEFGPIAFINYWSVRIGRVTQKYYSVDTHYPDPDEDSWNMGGFSSRLIRISALPSGVNEVASGEIALTALGGGAFYDLTGRATLSKIIPTQTAPMWFARRLTGGREFYWAADDTTFAGQGQPVPGSYFKYTDLLTFNATETRAVAAMDFEDAVAEVIRRLEAKGYVLDEED